MAWLVPRLRRVRRPRDSGRNVPISLDARSLDGSFLVRLSHPSASGFRRTGELEQLRLARRVVADDEVQTACEVEVYFCEWAEGMSRQVHEGVLRHDVSLGLRPRR